MGRAVVTSRGVSRRRSLVAGALVLAATTGLLGCGPGVECDACDNDKDCKTGLTCEEFSDGNTYCTDGDATCIK